MIARMHDLVRDKSQFIIATPLPILMSYPDAFIHQFSPGGVERVSYEKTERYRVTRSFLSNPERALKILFDR